jgi:hypothetical protein
MSPDWAFTPLAALSQKNNMASLIKDASMKSGDLEGGNLGTFNEVAHPTMTFHRGHFGKLSFTSPGSP